MTGLSLLPKYPPSGRSPPARLMAAPTTMFFSERVATTRSWVLNLAAEIMKLFGSSRRLGHAAGVRVEILLVKAVERFVFILVQIHQLGSVFGRHLS